MTDTITLNASTPEYWDDVKRRTTVRNADAIVKRKLENLRPSQVYEQWVADHLDIIRAAAVTAKVADYQAFKAKWARQLSMPEIAETGEQDLTRYAADAVKDAAEAMYG
ncbi:hypothetical protein [Loktanella sp. Alg231-35]|uniref:hypothetical protein n=1 Tax=Loktanella sp. Alg231-35 TaxID=1922220 RepID=UPI000D54F169|nr:hypothetical protein [Loktanella sp. Alg231-35]